MTRALLATAACLLALGLGLLTVHLSARNRARAAELDSCQRWCEIFARQSAALRAETRAAEWRLFERILEVVQ